MMISLRSERRARPIRCGLISAKADKLPNIRRERILPTRRTYGYLLGLPDSFGIALRVAAFAHAAIGWVFENNKNRTPLRLRVDGMRMPGEFLVEDCDFSLRPDFPYPIIAFRIVTRF